MNRIGQTMTSHGDRFFARQPHRVGGAIGLASLPVHVWLPHALSIDLAALILALIAGIYVGFAVAARHTGIIIFELVFAVGFAALAFAGIFINQWLIPAAYLLHAGWDLLHRHGRLNGILPRWYVPFCILVDLVAGSGLIVIWLQQP